jgi:hypothetical protein
VNDRVSVCLGRGYHHHQLAVQLVLVPAVKWTYQYPSVARVIDNSTEQPVAGVHPEAVPFTVIVRVSQLLIWMPWNC